MNLGYFSYPLPVNEPVYTYAPGSPEREALKKTVQELKSKPMDIPMYIGSEEVRTGNIRAIHPPHEIAATVAHYHGGDETHRRAPRLARWPLDRLLGNDSRSRG